jgi:hypothetical protein
MIQRTRCTPSVRAIKTVQKPPLHLRPRLILSWIHSGKYQARPQVQAKV